jgi:acid stress chaperone HdeB
MKRLLVAASIAVGSLSTQASAEVIDMATIKCSDIGTMSDEEGGTFFIWLHGYYGGQAGDTTMDTDAMTEAGTRIGEYCASNPDVGVMSAVKMVFAE